MRHRTNRVAPFAVALALSLGVAACDGASDAGDGIQVEGETGDTTDSTDSPDTGGTTDNSDY